MFLFFGQSEAQRSYKHGSYSKKGVYSRSTTSNELVGIAVNSLIGKNEILLMASLNMDSFTVNLFDYLCVTK